MDEEFQMMIANAIRLNPDFPNMTTQKQYEFLKYNLEPELLKEELEFYYDSKFGYPLNSMEFKRINL